MKLAEFILVDMEAILAEWESFAATRLPAAATMKSLALRDHAGQILEAIASDIVQPQTDAAQAAKGMGRAPPLLDAAATAAQTHAVLRSNSGFDVNQLVAEYRALRASVLRLWAARCAPVETDLQEVMRFNEAIDQALSESVAAFSNEVDTARKRFAGMLGHDMRTPLHVLLLSAALLGKMNAGPEVETVAKRLTTSGAQLKGLVDDFLDFNRAQLGLGMDIEPGEVDLAQVFHDELDQQRAARPGRVVVLQAAGHLRGTFDAARLRRLIGNLVSNALKYGSPSAAVVVALDGSGDDIAFSVANQGPKIAPAMLRRIFEPMQRGDAADGAGGSLGLGLYICREIAAAHGGEISAASSDTVTTFSVRLPRTRPTAPVHAPPRRRRPPPTTDDPLFGVQVAGPESIPDNHTGRLFRDTDWAATPLGAIAHWPHSLRTAVGICMNSRVPMFVWWGPALVNLYNDACIPMLGRRHPKAFGRPAQQVWADIWHTLTPQVDAVMRDGQASWNERAMLTVERDGVAEQAGFTWSYSPVHTADGAVGGLFCAVTAHPA